MVNRAYSGVSACDVGARGAGVDTDIERGFEGDGEIVDVVRLRWKCFMPSRIHGQDGVSSGGMRGDRTNTARFTGSCFG